MTRSIEQTRSAGLCAGCGLCAGIAPDDAVIMEESAQGYLRPKATAAVPAEVLAKVNAACPGVVLDEPAREADGTLHPTWGPVAQLHYAWARDEELRHLGSSGGGLSAVLAYLLDTGEVDFVVATAMSAEAPTRNRTVHLTGLEEIKDSAGSRYAPSAPLARIGALLDEGRKFVFVGKPCDVAALRQLARVDPRVDRQVPWMFAFFCAGVPSYHGTNALLQAMGVPEGANLQSFRFRGEGWPGFAKAVLEDGTSYTMDYDTSWGSILSRHLQFRCKVCPDGIGEFADIAFADGWHITANGKPSFEEAQGRSLTVLRKSRAVALFEAAVAAGYLACEPANIEHLPAMQPHQALRKGVAPSRLAAFALVGHRLPRFRKLNLLRNAKRVAPGKQARNFLGTLRRLIRKRTEG